MVPLWSNSNFMINSIAFRLFHLRIVNNQVYRATFVNFFIQWSIKLGGPILYNYE